MSNLQALILIFLAVIISHSQAWKRPQLNCLSWRLGLEEADGGGDAVRKWPLVASSCENFVGHNLDGRQYREWCEAVADAAVEYAKGIKLGGKGNEVWVFDIDDTALSNLPYFARSDVQFGTLGYFNETLFDEWVATGEAPAIPAIRRFYKVVLALKIKPVFLSTTKEKFRQARISNLLKAGYSNWEKLILKGESDKESEVEYNSEKRRKLEEAGYRIVGNIGDQYMDLIGEIIGRTFKFPFSLNSLYLNMSLKPVLVTRARKHKLLKVAVATGNDKISSL